MFVAAGDIYLDLEKPSEVSPVSLGKGALPATPFTSHRRLSGIFSGQYGGIDVLFKNTGREGFAERPLSEFSLFQPCFVLLHAKGQSITCKWSSVSTVSSMPVLLIRSLKKKQNCFMVAQLAILGLWKVSKGLLPDMCGPQRGWESCVIGRQVLLSQGCISCLRFSAGKGKLSLDSVQVMIPDRRVGQKNAARAQSAIDETEGVLFLRQFITRKSWRMASSTNVGTS